RRRSPRSGWAAASRSTATHPAARPAAPRRGRVSQRSCGRGPAHQRPGIMRLELCGEIQQQRFLAGPGRTELNAEGQLHTVDLLAVQRNSDRGRAEHVPGAGPRGEGALRIEVILAAGELQLSGRQRRGGERGGEYRIQSVEGLEGAPGEGLHAGERTGEVDA